VPGTGIGGTAGVTGAESAEAGPAAVPLSALTRIVYAVPFASPVIEHESVAVVQLLPGTSTPAA
jgi:hypothetical protein